MKYLVTEYFMKIQSELYGDIQINKKYLGDVLNMLAMINDEFVRMFRKFDPVKRMIISRDTGLLNPYFVIGKSQLIDFYHYATL